MKNELDNMLQTWGNLMRKLGEVAELKDEYRNRMKRELVAGAISDRMFVDVVQRDNN